MRIAIALAALVAVAACSKPEPAAETQAAATTAAAPEATNIAADGQASVGTYKVTAADGKVYVEEVKADGTYQSTLDGKVNETGTWVQKNPNLYCTTKTGEAEKCNEEKVENGVWTSKNAKGEVSTVERVPG
ncbi:hypothetical protein [Novosphingobium sp.]|jgi:hypothetical protein|uniref:hypothetical protein n=1 Tax=Novosphingobium sp. TaxID=1874826 RepID=UPI0022C61834|nr:hypothetical protein [Novosphingobium sp.]MCZ8019314.1 hypothetical protein [Novosphingobium sp.]MCZ8035129.1 hypothetical protein [Novosphingobium sp.]MCZ8050443.1 hypothetical protein [Novosphingobium sp.]MCZ8058789.1 hypothetical protein [Novosphingobium sp.]MCZ8232234.1 hypothetical protein [Novosphingobium sp.]